MNLTKKHLKFAEKLHEIFNMDVTSTKKEMMPSTRAQAKRIKKLFLLDPAGVCGIEPMNELSYRLLTTMVCNVKNRYGQSPDLDIAKCGKAKYSMNYVWDILNAFNDVCEAVTIITKDDYPMILFFEEGDLHFRVVIAPRVPSE